jgi:hypothetical protein
MAPEHARPLAVLDLDDPAAGRGGTVYRWDPDGAGEELIVLWEAPRCPSDFIEVAGGVVCVAVPPGYRAYRYELNPFDDPLAPSWRGQVRDSALMVVAILPPLHRFAEPRKGCVWPIAAKLLGDRVAVYWFFTDGNATVEPAWRMAPADRAELADCRTEINERPSPTPPHEPPLPSEETLRAWAEQRAAPIEGRPPS